MTLKTIEIQKKIKKFLRWNFKNEIFYYQLNERRKVFEIYIEDIKSYDSELYFIFIKKPEKITNLIEFTIKGIIQKISNISKDNLKENSIQIIFLRKFFNNIPADTSELIEGGFLSLKTIILSVSRLKLRFSGKREETINNDLKGVTASNFDLNEQRSFFKDYQTAIAKGFLNVNFKKQENRQLILILEGIFTRKIFPGDEIFVSGTFLFNDPSRENRTFHDFSGKKEEKLIIKVIGFSKLNFSNKFRNTDSFEHLDENFIKFARSRNIYKWIYSLVLPSIEETVGFKKALSCLLFGGSRKILANNFFFNGQISILIVGKEPDLYKKLHNYFKELEFRSNESNFNIGINDNSKKNIQLKFKSASMIELSRIYRDFSVLLIDDFHNLNTENQAQLEQFLDTRNFLGETNFFSTDSDLVSIIAWIDDHTENKILQNRNLTVESTIFRENINKFDLIISSSDLIEKKIYHPTNEKNFNKNLEAAPLEFLKNYIVFTRKKFKPNMSKKAFEFIKNAYVFLKFSKKKGKNSNTVGFEQARHLETMIKISEAIAKMRMSNNVDSIDALESIRLIQKHSF